MEVILTYTENQYQSSYVCHCCWKLTERMKAVDLPFLYPGYLLHQASPGCKPGVCEHAPAMLFMPIYFVLGQHGIQSPSRHDSVISTDLSRGEGTCTCTVPKLGTCTCRVQKYDMDRQMVRYGEVYTAMRNSQRGPLSKKKTRRRDRTCCTIF